mmetsp:Transcript_31075/g.75781  ORF Transcript_31075/g.75781 Transcript_31075/m.75781 type:complete len:105 (-) Transcript_31075:300-614(-)|eukprot:CAMPEP_0114519902 /NCGR_PEP_ID=MMETSP0109-20121206/19271_1 /TAXON_ID=29199 /ORGANISM="Chlorarachnion reptans, Strain CCCM449" /LENGTH=104 /DNA_ID=CAMNT_0001700713 /DNA_START=89 /DNA_END=403 /DNA_ORIENTATION=+
MAHTIILLKLDKDSKTQNIWEQFDSPSAACDGVCQIFERKLKADNPGQRKITYDISDLFGFIDEIQDLACMVLDMETHTYIPHDKKWMKKQVYRHLKEQVAGSE